MSIQSIRLGLAAAVLAAAGLPAGGVHSARAASPSPAPAVIVVVVDGLEPESVSPILTPNLWRLVVDAEARRWTNASAIMVTETNPNHTAMLTGTYGDRSGLLANRFFNVKTGTRENMESPSLILVPTLFDAIESQKPQLGTASIMGKEKLRRLFDCTRTVAGGPCGPSSDNPEMTPVIHVRPDFVGGASTSFDPDAIEDDTVAEPVSGSGYSLDNQIMDIVIARQTAAVQPDFTFVNLSDVDGFEHLFGSRSAQGRAVVINADANIGRLVSALKHSGRWSQTILFVTADHSFQDTGNPIGDDPHVANPVTPNVTGTLLVLSDVLGRCPNGTSFFAVSNGGSASVAIRDPGYDPYAGTPLTPAQKACLVLLRSRALATPGVDEALYRLPVEADPATVLPVAHPEWRLDTPRLGELLLTAEDAYSFTESRTSTYAVLAGNHGGPTSLPVPFFVASGSSLLAHGTDATNAVRRVDIAPTVAWLLGINPPAAAEGRVLCEAFTVTGCP